MAYISFDTRQSTPQQQVRWGRVAVLGASVALWAGLIALAAAVF